ncbi:hypothetical protein M0813_05091 [Anaeramoeba flamelloides]|uniref:Uncharacterized protein n=1 Tax=Anaeramoeba flamelloides TaxID=1746091 RepID=A0AAV7YB89_9EUKA|nr:hypothetical protein M0812_26637 [Anaeramoeba flamelloides]KAJ6232173.1 hypothetical protein M0813_05091 [Anaeramoeba flamelloides]
MFTQFELKQETPSRPSLKFKTAYVYTTGGLCSIASRKLSNPLNGKLLSMEGVGSVFLRSAFNQVLTENIKGYLRTHLKMSRKPKDAWKMGIVAGLCVGLTRPLFTTFWANLKRYHSETTFVDEHEAPYSPFSSMYDFVQTEGFSHLFNGYFSKAFHDVTFSTALYSIKEMNSYLIKHKWLKYGPNESMPRRVFTNFIIGVISASQASFITKPIVISLTDIYRGNDFNLHKIWKRSVNDAKRKAPSIGFKMILYGTLRSNLQTVNNAFKKALW